MALDRGEVLRSHWRPSTEWTGGDYVTWHLLPAPGGPVAARAAGVASALDGVPGLEPVPVPWLHLTLQGVGERAALGAGELPAVVDAERGALHGVSSPTLTFGPPQVHHEGVLLEAGREAPGGAVTRVRDAVRTGIAAAGRTAPGADDDPVWPHVSLAYCHAPVPAAEVLDALTPSAGASDATTETFGDLSLLALRRDGRRYVWDVLAVLPLD